MHRNGLGVSTFAPFIASDPQFDRGGFCILSGFVDSSEDSDIQGSHSVATVSSSGWMNVFLNPCFGLVRFLECLH